jgi:hypothetical protein
MEDVERDSGRLRQVMQTLAGRCLVDWTQDAPAAVLRKVAHRLPAQLVDGLTASIAIIPELLDEIGKHRRQYTAAVDEYKATTKSKLVPLTWARDLPADPDAARRVVSPRRLSTASPVAADALAVVGALQRAVELWQDTEQARYRRPYLRAFGEPQALPPCWLMQLRAAASR